MLTEKPEKTFSRSPRSSQNEFVCYFLTNKRNRRFTYVGFTNNFKRRLRQHNGEIKGGASYTQRYRPWTPFIIVSGFPSKRAALQFEWAMKHRRRGKRGGIQGRIQTMEWLMFDVERWTKKAPRVRDMLLHVRVWMTREEYVRYTHVKSGCGLHVGFEFQTGCSILDSSDASE